jgi:hypothetical protein
MCGKLNQELIFFSDLFSKKSSYESNFPFEINPKNGIANIAVL